jgi:hypothetical protein
VNVSGVEFGGLLGGLLKVGGLEAGVFGVGVLAYGVVAATFLLETTGSISTLLGCGAGT